MSYTDLMAQMRQQPEIGREGSEEYLEVEDEEYYYEYEDEEVIYVVDDEMDVDPNAVYYYDDGMEEYYIDADGNEIYNEGEVIDHIAQIYDDEMLMEEEFLSSAERDAEKAWLEYQRAEGLIPSDDTTTVESDDPVDSWKNAKQTSISEILDDEKMKEEEHLYEEGELENLYANTRRNEQSFDMTHHFIDQLNEQRWKLVLLQESYAQDLQRLESTSEALDLLLNNANWESIEKEIGGNKEDNLLPIIPDVGSIVSPLSLSAPYPTRVKKKAGLSASEPSFEERRGILKKKLERRMVGKRRRLTIRLTSSDCELPQRKKNLCFFLTKEQERRQKEKENAERELEERLKQKEAREEKSKKFVEWGTQHKEVDRGEVRDALDIQTSIQFIEDYNMEKRLVEIQEQKIIKLKQNLSILEAQMKLEQQKQEETELGLDLSGELTMQDMIQEPVPEPSKADEKVPPKPSPLPKNKLLAEVAGDSGDSGDSDDSDDDSFLGERARRGTRDFSGNFRADLDAVREKVAAFEQSEKKHVSWKTTNSPVTERKHSLSIGRSSPVPSARHPDNQNTQNNKQNNEQKKQNTNSPQNGYQNQQV